MPLSESAASGAEKASRPNAESAIVRVAWEEGLAALYRAEFEPMVRLAYVMTRDQSAADDIVQEAFYRVAMKWRSGPLQSPGGYLRTAVVTGCIDAGRRQTTKASALRTLTARAERSVDLSPNSSAGEPLAGLLSALPVEQRAVVVLRFWLDLPLREIAEHCDCSVNTVNSRLRRALASLRKVVKP